MSEFNNHLCVFCPRNSLLITNKINREKKVSEVEQIELLIDISQSNEKIHWNSVVVKIIWINAKLRSSFFIALNVYYIPLTIATMKFPHGLWCMKSNSSSIRSQTHTLLWFKILMKIFHITTHKSRYLLFLMLMLIEKIFQIFFYFLNRKFIFIFLSRHSSIAVLLLFVSNSEINYFLCVKSHSFTIRAFI
jgi:hypothetical protein